MAISAISGVNINKTHRNNISFGQNNGEAETSPQQGPKRASNFVKVPVIMLMTLSPSLLNSTATATEKYQDDFNYPQTEQLYAMAAPEPQSSTSSTPRRSSYVRPEVVQYQKTFTSGGKQYTMYYVHDEKAENPNSKYVSEVYFVPKGYQPVKVSRANSDDNRPPKLVGIIYHDLPNGKEFVGGKITEITCDKYGHEDSRKWVTKEIVLPPDIANGLMDLVKGRTKFVVPPKGAIARMFQNMEATTSPSLMRETVK